MGRVWRRAVNCFLIGYPAEVDLFPQALIASDPVLSEYEPSDLRDDLAELVCEAIDNQLPFDEILWSIYAESPADWDTDTAAIFLGSAVYGVCPEHSDAIDEWIDEL